MFLRAEQSGLRLAIIGRIVALVLLGVWLIGTRADDPARALGYVLVLSLFAALGLAHYALIGTRFDRRWVKYVFITLDIAIVSAIVATQPLYPSAADLPAVMTFRAPVFPFYFVILGVAAFSFSPAHGVVDRHRGRDRLARRFLAFGKQGRWRAQLERDPAESHGRADHGGRARPQVRRAQWPHPGGSSARGGCVPDRRRDVARARHPPAPARSRTGPRHPVRAFSGVSCRRPS